MSDTSKLSTCQLVCWGLAGLAGLFILWAAAGAVGFLAALILAVGLAVLLGLAFIRLVCTGYRAGDRGIETSDLEAGLRHVTGVTGYKAPYDEDEDSRAARAPEPVSGFATQPASTPASQPAPEAASRPAPEPAPPPAPGPEPVTAAPEPEPEPAADTEFPDEADTRLPDEAVRPGSVLAGEQELAERKGTWRYDPAPAPAAAAATDDATESGADVGHQPAALAAPRGGQADDLQQIKGVGPKLKAMLHDLGIFHFEQIAGWTADEVAWLDANLKGFPGRVSRENWVEQASALARGESPEARAGGE